jgi:hypothetical protein
LGDYDFLAANAQLIAQLATGRLKPGELLAASRPLSDNRDVSAG